MKKTHLIISVTSILFLISTVQAFQISFTGQNLGLRGSSFGALEAGDFDNDGDLDLLVIGEEDIGTRVGLVYINSGSGFNSVASLTLPYALRIADAKWGDYDNDGDLDILVSGQSGGRLTTILKNDAGTFVEEDFNLLNMEDGSVDWGDYDNDGDLDIAVTGRDINFNRPLKIYENQDGSFVDSGITLDGVESGDIEWIDYDVDGDLDILISGLNGGRRSELYKQENGSFSFQQGFEGVLNAASDWGDYDQDGDPDLLLCGNNLGQFSGLYKNDAGNLNQVALSLTGVEKGDVKWADFDNDGDLDFILNGEGTDADTTLIYENTGTGFSALDLGLPKFKNSAIAVGDFDNDRDVDFVIAGWNSLGNRFTLVFSNNASNANTAPQKPVNLRHNFTPDGVVLNWDRGMDNETSASGLTYNVRLGTTPGGSEIISANVTALGKHTLARRGNNGSTSFRRIANLPLGTYYWSVQSVDNNYSTSDFAEEHSFELKISATFNEIDAGIPGFQNGEMAWGDYDNDGDLDLAITGFDNDALAIRTAIMTNNGGDSFTLLDAGLQNASGGSVDWGDFDRDGDLDLLLSGYLTETLVYRNNNSNFVKVDAGLPGFNNGDALWIDYDNDGDLDIFLAPKGEIYENNGTGFALDSEASSTFQLVTDADAAIGDYDNDGDKDIIVVGTTGQYYGYLYRNDGGTFTDWGFDFDVTSDGQGFGHPNNGMALADADWSDYDNDGDLDFVMSGEGRSNTADIIRVTVMYENRGPDLNNAGKWLFEQTETTRFPNQRMYEGLNRGSLDWADFDLDGKRDFIVAGSQGSTINSTDYRTIIYSNNGSNIFEIDEATNGPLRGMGNSAVAVADYDNDNDLDFIEFGYSGTNGGLGYATRLYKNTIFDVTNAAPEAPANLRYSVSGDTVVLHWDAANDDKTPSDGLTYNVSVGLTTGSDNVVPAHADLVTGKLRKVFRGNTESALQYKIVGLPENNTFYWSVQAIDAGLAGSDFATFSTFNTFVSSVTVTSPNGGEDAVAGETYNITWNADGITNVSIDFSADAGSNWINIAGNIEGSGGQFAWTVPDQVTNQALIRISDANNAAVFDVSDNPFNIVNRFINVIHPNGGEVFFVDSSYFVDYYTPYESDFRIEFSTNNGQAWTQIGVESSSFGDQSILWTVPDIVSAECLIRVTDIQNTAVVDLSDNVFSIQRNNTPFISITAPNGGENWQVGSTKNITWTTNSVSDLTIEYSTNGGNNWVTEHTSVIASSGNYGWMIPNIQSDNCLVRISETGNMALNDVSDASFSIVGSDEPYINVLSPVGGEIWEIYTTQMIQWESNNIANIKIEISINGGANYQTIQEAVSASPSSYQWVVENLYSDQCLIRLSSSENNAINAVSNNYFSITDSTKPQIVIDDPVEDQPMNQPTQISALVVDNTTIQSVTLHYKQGGQLNFSSATMNRESVDRYTAEIPGFAIGETGVHYYVSALDVYNNRGVSENYSVAVIFSQGLVNPSVPPAGTDLSSYRLFSIPVELDNLSPASFITNNTDLGSYDKERFRWYSLNANTQILNEYPDIGNLTLGRGYLFITRDDVAMSSGLGTTADISQPYRQNLPRGWNLIGNPFNFAVDSIYSIPEMDLKIWKYEGDWQLNGNVLQPWIGYAVNLSSAADLYIVPRKSAGTLSKPVYTSHQNTDREWLIRIKANDGKSVSSFNFAGQFYDAVDGLDKYDLQTPPRLPGQLVVSFNANSSQSADIRSVHEDGNVWDVTCFTNPERESLNLQFSGVQFSENQDVFLVDMDTHTSYNLKNKANLVFATKGLQQKNFVLAVGTREYLNGLDMETDFYPSVFDLKPVFPNPFNPVTQLNFSISENAKVKLEVFNVLGQQVAVLLNQNMESGNYSAVWDAGTISSGIYIFKLSAGQKIKIRRGLLIK